MTRLFSREDKNRSHALLGFSSIINYILQFRNIYYYKVLTSYQYVLIPMHLLLSLSSLKFKVNSKRHDKLVIITPTIRAHSILFAYRGLICYIIHSNSPSYRIFLCSIYCYSNMYLADFIIKYYNDIQSERTMRDMPFNMSKLRYNLLLNFYSGMQIAATLNCIYFKEISFLTSFVIQFASFLKTLVKKGKISNKYWHFFYSMSLSFVVFLPKSYYLNDLDNGIKLSIIGFITWIARVKFNISKYKIWLFSIILINNLNKININYNFYDINRLYFKYLLDFILTCTSISGIILSLPI